MTANQFDQAPYGDTEDDTRFWKAASQGYLVFQTCLDCNYVRWPAAGVCSECLSRRSEWREVDGQGALWSYVHYHRAYAPRWKGHLPYTVGLVQLDCGVRLITRLVDLEAADTSVGMRLHVQYRTLEGGDEIVPVFAPA